MYYLHMYSLNLECWSYQVDVAVNTLVIFSSLFASRITDGSGLSYFHVFCHQPVCGPLVGGSAESKDVNKWLD